MSEPKHLGILRVSDEMLLQALRLPPGTAIIDARLNFDSRVVEFVVEHESLPRTDPGNWVSVIEIKSFAR